MALRIRTNVMSLVAQRHFGDSGARVQSSMNKLSSGHRITKAADDAAGFAISEVIRADLRSLAQARRNTNDGVSLLQVAEGSLEEINNIMVRLRELAIQSASDTIGDKERGYLNLEFFQLKDEMERIALSTEFNGTRMLAGSSELPEELAGAHAMPPLEVQVDKDYWEDVDSLDSPNPMDIIRMDFSKMNALTEGEGSLDIGNPRNEDGTSVASKVEAQQSISRLDTAMGKVAGYRANIGALQNRLESADRNIAIRIENLATARSRIRDADFAAETAAYTQNNIMQQAGSQILAQANSLPEIALQLLQ